MKRDEDLLRQLLFDLEQEDDFVSAAFVEHMNMPKEDRVKRGHVLLLADAGLVAPMSGEWSTFRLTNDGHDFIAAVRQDTVWNKTKETASKAGSVTLSMLFEIAVALGKEKLRQATGLALS
ncbi:DUF2513 domain-containing protein [uncultured Roseobacter sp.]|uniref:DUF2513 domain-containing protein n=1 Tax=uncultured Roseobacter sp. TaxID=114847 RepID=UPI00261A8BDF|nr:DUF2513 domain-containing protein [uncultured Roseobacter sp.]